MSHGRKLLRYYWRTASGREVDLLVERSPGSIIAIEAKKERPGLDDATGLQALDSAEEGMIQHRVPVARTPASYRLDDGTRLVGMEGLAGMLSKRSDLERRAL